VIIKLHVKKRVREKKNAIIFMHAKQEELETYLIPWPGPQVIYVASTFSEPITIEIKSSPSINKT
jgi:hypothetical protein